MTNWERLIGALDPERQLPAVRELRNAVVAAGAGSGKTRVLSVRYLALIKERGIPPERILCLTFTNKAAAEMKERIRGMLASCAADDPDFARALGGFSASRIGTLDSFCSDIARNASSAWGVAPDFSIDQTEANRATETYALDYLLARRDEPAAAAFIAANGLEAAKEALAALARGRGGLIAADRSALDPRRQAEALGQALRQAHDGAAAILRAGLGLDCGGAAGAEAWRKAAEEFETELGGGIPEPPDYRALINRYASLAALRKPGGKSEAAVYYNGSCDELRLYLAAATAAAAALAEPLREAALDLIAGFLDGAADRRAAAGVVGFGDVASMARAALIRDPTLRAWYKSRFDAIMIDEFQDNNGLQKDILYLVAEELDAEADGVPGPERLRAGSLFFVGDEKQSIYAFRGADVRVFRGLADELARSPGGLGRHELAVNWRSEPGLIAFFNETFSKVMPDASDRGARDYQARFSPLGHGPATEGVGAVARYHELEAAAADGELGYLESLAAAVTRLVASLVGRELVSASAAGGVREARPCRYEDIALLFRSTAAQNVVERHFRRAKIPYRAESTAGLFVESPLGDLYAALKLAAYPNDALAYAAVLRGPFARLSERGAFELLEAGVPAFGREPPALSPDDAARYAEARYTWAELRRRADREPLASLIEWLWWDRGLRWDVLRRPENAAYLEHYDYAWGLAAEADARGRRLCVFLAELEERMGRVEKLDASGIQREGGAEGVALMTVHGSKGLEFPVVIVPFADATGRNEPRGAVELSERFGYALRLIDEAGDPACPVAELERVLAKLAKRGGDKPMDETIAESQRLFYVACTRAVSRLHIMGRAPSKGDADGRSFRTQLLEAFPWLGPPRAGLESPARTEPDGGLVELVPEPAATLAELRRAGSGGASPEARAAAAAAAAAAAEAPSPRTRRARISVSEAAALAVAPAPAEASASAEPPAERPPEPPTAETAPRRERDWTEADFGTLCHILVERALSYGALVETAQPDELGLPDALARKLGKLGATERAGLLAEARGLAAGFLNSGRGRRALAARDRARAGDGVFELELPFTYRHDGIDGPVYLAGAMDLVYGDGDSVTVIDFKTDVELRPERHEFQLSLYREAAASLYGRPAEAYVHYLRGGVESEYRGAPALRALDEALREAMANDD